MQIINKAKDIAYEVASIFRVQTSVSHRAIEFGIRFFFVFSEYAFLVSGFRSLTHLFDIFQFLQ